MHIQQHIFYNFFIRRPQFFCSSLPYWGSVYCSVDLDENGTKKDAMWMNGTICRVSDGNWLLTACSKIRCHPAGEAAEVLFDAVPKIGYKACKDIIALKPILWNKDKEGAWCKYLGEIDYGVVE